MSDGSTSRRDRIALWGLILAAVLLVWVALAVVQGRLFRLPSGGGLLETLAIFALINFNILLLLLLLFLILRNLAKLAFERRTGVLGAHLRTKLVLAFLTMTVIPTALLYLASAGFLSRSIDSWFTRRVEGALRQAMDVARAHYKGEEERVLHYARQIAELLPKESLGRDLGSLETMLLARATENQLGAVAVYSVGGEVLSVVANPKYPVPDVATERSSEVEQALAGKEATGLSESARGDFIRAAVPILTASNGKVVGAVAVDGYISGRLIDRLKAITAGFEEYRQLEVLKAPIKVSYILPLAMVALLIAFAATWFGFYLARGITGPIQALALGTQRVAEGDLDFQLEVTSRDEVGTLVESFNRMTRDLKVSESQVAEAQATLQRANEELERRRRYMEIVLGRVTAGVMSSDREGRITTVNRAAEEMLGLGMDAVGKSYREVLPPAAEAVVSDLVSELRRLGQDSLQRQVVLPIAGARKIVKVHLTTLRDEAGDALGTVVVVDDLTDLVKAQRAQAWQEVARRMAHEIKNPLTPIQLSAQRLRRRYAQLLEDEEGGVLDEATRTIVGQVEELKHLVNEFSRFAKLPETKPVPSDLNAVVEEVAGFYRQGHTDIQFLVQTDPHVPILLLDTQQIKRVLVNLLDNAVAALGGNPHSRIEVHTEYDPQASVVRLVVADNGAGLSDEAKERLFEPYFSTKKGGTGLGLAIVQSILQDHRGHIRASDNQPQGTRFVVELPSGASAA